MTAISKTPIHIFIDHAFEAWFALGMVLIAAGSLLAGVNPSGLLEGTLDTTLYALWQWGLFVFGSMTLAALGSRPLAMKRATVAGREGGLATLRVYEAAGCSGLAAAIILYGATLALDGVQNSAFVLLAMLAFAAGFAFRARRLHKDNRDRLAVLRTVNGVSD